MNDSSASLTAEVDKREGSLVCHPSRAHLMHVFPSFALGGVPNRIATIINRLGNGNCHKILALDGQYGAAETLGSNANVDLIAFDCHRQSFINTIRSIRCWLKFEKPDALLTYNWGAIEWAFANTLYNFGPHVHFESGFGKDEESALLRRRNRFRRLALFRARRVVVPSQTLARIAEDAWRIPRRKVQILPNSLLQAMAAGGPVMATDVGDVKRMVAPENCPYVVAKTDEKGFMKGLEDLVSDGEKRLILGQRNQAYARTYYRIDKMVSAYKALFDDTLQTAQ
jgi:hypothetical protein